MVEGGRDAGKQLGVDSRTVEDVIDVSAAAVKPVGEPLDCTFFRLAVENCFNELSYMNLHVDEDAIVAAMAPLSAAVINESAEPVGLSKRRYRQTPLQR